VHYYQFNIGDYASHTSRLNIYEDIAYRRLLDLYYLTERPLNGCSKTVAWEIGMSDSLGDVDYVLSKYFIKDGDKWVHNRCEKEIKAYQSRQSSASKAGKASGIARKNKKKERPFNDRSTDVQRETNEPSTNHKPITKNQEPSKKHRTKFCPPSLEEVSQYCLERKNTVDPQTWMDFYTSNGWKVGKNSMKDWKAAVRTWEKRKEVSNERQRPLSAPERIREANRQAAIKRGDPIDGEII